ncbi:DUF58 domain-containing protein [Arthrobacter sp. zg-Y453]|uniref:DUF58 domain-containing protein n=1 Tax=Arthrobacter caoxuetaonis TaxID=2886935 RepID=A0A9X1MC30_9MICC|nr:DUF58 domain-containing protein [Arthrobacter caoxuetaonis]MCC3297188.1 DUF58 domain-containing protein [Arthrobacter caoxuetaonis]USQ58816.1 DUF58 domain-containing protein [Arthrobacter caoxuetaonis]
MDAARRRWWPRAAAAAGSMTPLGWSAAALAAGFWAAGGMLGWRELLIAAAFLTLVLVAAVGFIVGRQSYAVRLDLARTRVAVGDDAVGSLTVGNPGARMLLPATLELPVGAATAVFELPRMAPGDEHEELFRIPTQRRAMIVVGPVESVRRDPFGLMGRRLVWTDPVDLFVHPRTVGLQGSATGFIKDLEGLPTRELSTADVAFHALREYVPGDDRRHIHWKTTARTGTLMVRQFEETRRSHLAVALSGNTADYGSEADLELAVSVAGSLGLQAIREQRDLTVLSQDGQIRSGSGRILLDGLTRFEGRERREGTRELAALTSDSVPNASVVILVTGTAVSASVLRSAAAAISPGIRCLAVRCSEGEPPGRREIADLTVLTCGALDDLPALIRKGTA